jgi:hypothetical protein
VYDFEGFPSIARLQREIVITEKLDGTNSQIFIDDSGRNMLVGSRNRWLTAETDNFGFARWCNEHYAELLTLGPGRHFGEWFGSGIQRGYGLKEKRFALFNTRRWVAAHEVRIEKQEFCPACCTVVPVLARGPFSETLINRAMVDLRVNGSAAAPGFMSPEGIVVYHTAAKVYFKRTFEHDEAGKGATI